MELWSNPALSEFVIMFNSESVARTSLEEKCNKKMKCLIKKVIIIIGIIRFLSGSSFIFRTNTLNHFPLRKTAQHKGFKIETDIDFEDNEFNYRYMGGQRRQPLRRQPARKPELKCHFCNLEYCLDDDEKNMKNSGTAIKLRSRLPEQVFDSPSLYTQTLL